MAVTRDKLSSPPIITTTPIKRPFSVLGTTSPYPTVVTVATAHQRPSPRRWRELDPSGDSVKKNPRPPRKTSRMTKRASANTRSRWRVRMIVTTVSLSTACLRGAAFFTGSGSPSSSPSFLAAVAAFTLDGSGRLPQFSSGQVAALALAVEGGLGVADVSGGHQFVAVLAFLHREALPPEVAAAFIVMVALLAGDLRLGVARVAEQRRRLLPAGFRYAQPAFLRNLGGPPGSPGHQTPGLKPRPPASALALTARNMRRRRCRIPKRSPGTPAHCRYSRPRSGVRTGSGPGFPKTGFAG